MDSYSVGGFPDGVSRYNGRKWEPQRDYPIIIKHGVRDRVSVETGDAVDAFHKVLDTQRHWDKPGTSGRVFKYDILSGKGVSRTQWEKMSRIEQNEFLVRSGLVRVQGQAQSYSKPAEPDTVNISPQAMAASRGERIDPNPSDQLIEENVFRRIARGELEARGKKPTDEEVERGARIVRAMSYNIDANRAQGIYTEAQRQEVKMEKIRASREGTDKSEPKRNLQPTIETPKAKALFESAQPPKPSSPQKPVQTDLFANLPDPKPKIKTINYLGEGVDVVI